MNEKGGRVWLNSHPKSIYERRRKIIGIRIWRCKIFS